MRNRSSEVRLSHRGVGQGDEAHASGAGAHVSTSKTRKFTTEAHAHVQRRMPLYRGATPLDEVHGSGRGTQRRMPLWQSDAHLFVQVHASVA